jgi:uncharacterized protein YjbI with pentapeptide repeats
VIWIRITKETLDFAIPHLSFTKYTIYQCRRANFTSADMRESDFSGSTFNGAYLEKAVAYKANFTGELDNSFLLCR